jgi:hypothetical protein
MGVVLKLLVHSRLAVASAPVDDISWSADGQTVHMRGRPITLDRFRKMLHDVVAEAENILWAELVPTKRVELPLDEITDDMSMEPGVSFADGLQPRAKLRWMLAAHGGRLGSVPEVRKYIGRVDAFLELLLFAVHATGGPPPHGVDVTAIRHRNGTYGRNIFIIDGMAMFTTAYFKGLSPDGVLRYLPSEVTQLLAVHLAYVQPIVEHLEAQVLGGGRTDRLWTDHLWADAWGPWEPERLSRVLSRETRTRLGVELNLHEYRRVAVRIGRRKLGEEFVTLYDPEAEMDGDVAGEMGEDPEAEMDDWSWLG